MDSVLGRVLLSWDIRPDVSLTLLAAGILYSLGWWRLRKRGRGRVARNWRLAAYLGGLLVLGMALMSAIDVFQSFLFLMHMIQHLLLVMIAPLLLLLANPMPFFMWGLPVRARLAISPLFRRSSMFRRGLRRLTTAAICWFVFIIILLGWHDPNAYNASLRYGWLHDIEHITFFVSGLLYWWHIVGAGPRIHKPLSYGFRSAYLLGTVPFTMLLGVAIAFAQEPIYSYYITVPRLFGIDVVTDQRIGGLIMWIPGSMMYIFAALVIVARISGADNREIWLSVAVD